MHWFNLFENLLVKITIFLDRILFMGSRNTIRCERISFLRTQGRTVKSRHYNSLEFKSWPVKFQRIQFPKGIPWVDPSADGLQSKDLFRFKFGCNYNYDHCMTVEFSHDFSGDAHRFVVSFWRKTVDAGWRRYSPQVNSATMVIYSICLFVHDVFWCLFCFLLTFAFQHFVYFSTIIPNSIHFKLAGMVRTSRRWIYLDRF